MAPVSLAGDGVRNLTRATPLATAFETAKDRVRVDIPRFTPVMPTNPPGSRASVVSEPAPIPKWDRKNPLTSSPPSRIC